MTELLQPASQIATYTFITYCVFNPTAVFPNASGDDDTIAALAGTDVADMFSAVSTASDQLGEFIQVKTVAPSLLSLAAGCLAYPPRPYSRRQDLVIARNYIFGFGFAVCLFVAFFYTWLMSKGLVRVIVWGGISVTTVVLLALGGYLYLTGEDWKKDDTKETYQAYGVWGLGIAFLSLGGLWVAFIICICSKIELACVITEIAGNAIRDMSAVVLLPLIQVAGLVLFLVPWVYYMAGVNSQGSYVKTYTESTNTTTYSWEFDTGMGNQYTQTFFMFCYFWTTQFIVAMGQLILAVAFKGWYFNDPMTDEDMKAAMNPLNYCPTCCCCCCSCCCGGEKEEEDKKAVETTKTEDGEAPKQGCTIGGCIKAIFNCIFTLIAKIVKCAMYIANCLISCGGGAPERGNMVVFGAFFEAIYYHIGTAAAGSLIIAIIKTIQYIVAKVQYEVNKKLKHAGPIKWIANAILCCIQCCLWCIEKCMKFINKHAYIITAVRGKSFCAAACDAFFLICRNIRLIGAITVVQEFSVLLGKVFILMVTGFLSYVYMEQELGDCTNPDKPCVNSLIGPTLFVMILAYFIADMFCSIYSMAIDCIMHCYLVDHEVNEEGAKRYHNKDHLKELGQCIDKKGAREAKKKRESTAGKGSNEKTEAPEVGEQAAAAPAAEGTI